jgi:hypothetical protein
LFTALSVTMTVVTVAAAADNNNGSLFVLASFLTSFPCLL